MELNAEFRVEVDGHALSLVLESAGGKVPGARHSRNHEYVPALRLLLARLGRRQAVLLSAVVDSARVAHLTEDQRMLVRGPLALAPVVDVEALRREITVAQGRIGQAPGAKKEGNNRKRIRLKLDVPGYGTEDAARLAADLAEGIPDNSLAPDVADAFTAAESTAGKRSRSGQGMRLSPADRDAIEAHSVALAIAYLKKEGYTIKDVGNIKSYDLDATRSDSHLYVEVKGTTSDGDEIILTRKEVELNVEKYPDTMLIIVNNIDLNRSGPTPNASGGILQVTHPWTVEHSYLTPISYRYRVTRPST